MAQHGGAGHKKSYQFQHGRVLENEAEALMNFARRYVAALSHDDHPSLGLKISDYQLLC